MTSGSTFLIVSPLQTEARVEILMIAVLPQTEHRHRNANGEAAAAQSQLVSGCFMGNALLVGLGLELNSSESDAVAGLVLFRGRRAGRHLMGFEKIGLPI
jgi:hypothetical protein